MFGNIVMWEPFRYWCQKVIPAVYDDSLSYYELICKCIHYLNELGEMYNELVKKLEGLKEYIDEFLGDEIEDYVDQYINELIDNGFFDRFFMNDTVSINHIGILPHSFAVPGINEADYDFSYTDDDMYKNMQGGCMISPEIALIARVSGQPNDNSTLLQKVNVNTGEVIRYDKLQFGHCNSLTYDKKNSLVWQGGYLINTLYRDRVVCFNPNIPIGANNFNEYYLPGLTASNINQRLQSFVYSNTLDMYFAITANGITNPLDSPNGNIFTVNSYKLENDEFILVTHKEFPYNVGHNTACAFAWHEYFCVVYEQPGTIYVFDKNINLIKTIMIDKHVQGIRMANEIENVMSWDEDNLYIGYLLTGTHTQTYNYYFGGEIVQSRAAIDTDIGFGKLLIENKGFVSSTAALPSVAYSDYVNVYINPNNSSYSRDGSQNNPFQSLNELANIMTNEKLNSIVAFLLDDIDEDFKPIAIGDAKTYLNGGGHSVNGCLACINVDSITVIRTTFLGMQADLILGECSNNGITHWFQNATGIICQIPTNQTINMRATAFSDVKLQYDTSNQYVHNLSFSKFMCQNSIVTLPENALCNLLVANYTDDNPEELVIETSPNVSIVNSTIHNYKQRLLQLNYISNSRFTNGNLTKPLHLNIPFMNPVLLLWNMTIPETVSTPSISTDGQTILGRTLYSDPRMTDWSADEKIFLERLYTIHKDTSEDDAFRSIDIAMSAYNEASDTHFYDITINTIALETL